MKVVACSDLHGLLPEIPPCDLLLIAGDITPVWDHSIPFQERWLDTTFRAWLERVPARQVIGVAGNHDWLFQTNPELVPSLPWTYLENESTEFEGLKVWGSPYSKRFFDWAFNADDFQLRHIWSKIPDDTDIIVVHQPPYGYGDLVKPYPPYPGGHQGCKFLLERIQQIEPKLVVFGHIHPARGQWKWKDTTLANVTVVNEKYQMVHKPWTITL